MQNEDKSRLQVQLPRDISIKSPSGFESRGLLMIRIQKRATEGFDGGGLLGPRWGRRAKHRLQSVEIVVIQVRTHGLSSSARYQNCIEGLPPF